MPPLGEAVVIRQACGVCMRHLPLNVENFDFCPRCGRLVCKEKCVRTCPLCQVSRCGICLEEIHGNTFGSSCERCSQALRQKEGRYGK